MELECRNVGLVDDLIELPWFAAAAALPGEPACSQAVQLRSMIRFLDTEARAVDFAHRTLMYIGVRGFPRSMRSFWAEPFLSRTANSVDDQIADLRRRVRDVHIDAGICFIPAKLKKCGRKGGVVAQMSTLGGDR